MRSSSIEIVFHRGHLSSSLYSNKVIFHESSFSFGLSSIKFVFHSFKDSGLDLQLFKNKFGLYPTLSLLVWTDGRQVGGRLGGGAAWCWRKQN
jgi:hypothetical protein